MIARPQLDLLGVLPSQAATAAKATLGSAQARFDVALLQATKSLRDAEPEGQALVIDPKVQAAFEATLQQLAQSPVDQLNTLTQDKTALQGVVDSAAQAAGLGTEDKTVLGQLTNAALPRLAAYKAGMLSMGATAANDRGGAQPGPQGGTPALAGSPADSIQASPVNQAKERPQEQGNASSTLGAMAAQALTPVIVSTRTDDGSMPAGLVSLASSSSNASGASMGQAAPAPASQGIEAAQPQGRVVSISSSGGDDQAQAPVALAPQVEAAMQQGLSLQQGPVTQATGAETQQALNVEVPTSQPKSVPSNATVPTTTEDVQARFVPLTQAVAVEEGSVVTLKGKVSQEPMAPQSASAAASAPQNTAPQSAPVAASAPAPQVTAPQSAPVAASAPAPQVTASQSAPAAASAPAAQVTAPQSAPAAASAAAPQNTAPQPAPAAASAPASQVTAPQSAPTAASTPVVPVPQAGAALQAALAPVIAPVLSAPAPSAAAQAPSIITDERASTNAVAPSTVGASSSSSVAAPQSGASAVAGAKAQDATGPISGLGQQGQDPVKALAQQVAKDVTVKQNSFQQVTQALKDAPGAESGRLVISLKPASLGDVTVDLVLAGGKVSARLVASSPAVRDAFVQDLAGFKAGLESHGIAVSEVSVALRAGVQDQPQGQPQPQPQNEAWWRVLGKEKASDLSLIQTSAVYGGSDLGGDQRFSALA